MKLVFHISDDGSEIEETIKCRLLIKMMMEISHIKIFKRQIYYFLF